MNIEQARKNFGNDIFCSAKIEDGGWTCVCGTKNDLEANRCKGCGRSKDFVFKNITIDEKESVLISENKVTMAQQSAYGTARFVSFFISFLGWVAFVVGIIAAFASMGSLQLKYGAGVSVLALLPGLGISISGLFLVAAGQVTRATVDNADNTRQILDLLRGKA